MNNLSLHDHRRLGEELELFFFDESAPGIPYWLPKGVILRSLLFNYWRQYHAQLNYQEVASPLLNKAQLWERSGHLAHYEENMFGFESADKKEKWFLKPMNCANAMIIYGRRPRSYRELPLRLSDCDMLHRNESSGALLGLLRSRCFCQDDAHNFVSEEQVGSEIANILQIVKDFYAAFELSKNISLHFSSRPKDFMGELAQWDNAERALLNALEQSGMKFGIKEGDGAFYGPKIDIHLEDKAGRDWQCGTIQLDYQLPQRFALEYADRDGSMKRPVVIHRVIYGSVERFLGICLEHFEGRLPFWCAPIQVRVVPVDPEVNEYVEEVMAVLKKVKLSAPLAENSLRFDLDQRNESLAKRIRNAEREKIEVILVIGAQERQARSVNIRRFKSDPKAELVHLDNLEQALKKDW